jgi:predicted metal-binding protein
MSRISSIQRDIEQLPIHEYAFMDTNDVIFSKEVRDLCIQNKCGMYASSWACPPAIGSVDDCKARCSNYKHTFIFTTATKVKNRYDFKGWIHARKEHEKLTDRVADIFRFYDAPALVLSTEGCLLCKTCTFPDAPCRFPNRMYPATEGYGIMVMQQAKVCNVKYNNGVDTVTYFSMVFFNADQGKPNNKNVK